MLIEFVAPDPRAGTQVELEGNRAREFIASGNAVEVGKQEVKPNADHAGKSKGSPKNRGQ